MGFTFFRRLQRYAIKDYDVWNLQTTKLKKSRSRPRVIEIPERWRSSFLLLREFLKRTGERSCTVATRTVAKVNEGWRYLEIHAQTADFRTMDPTTRCSLYRGMWKKWTETFVKEDANVSARDERLTLRKFILADLRRWNRFLFWMELQLSKNSSTDNCNTNIRETLYWISHIPAFNRNIAQLNF